jgi:hypothetical protein
MKTPMAGLAAVSFLTGGVLAQIDIPANPGKFDGRSIGGGTSGGVEVIPKESPKIRYTTHVILSPSRQWTSSDGKVIEAKLIAFEDLVTDGVQGDAAPEPPAPPKHPTVVRAEKIRLLVNRKPVIVALERFSQADRDFVEQTRIAHQKKTPPNP